MSPIPSQEATAERAKLFAEFFNTMPVAALRDDVPAEMQKRIGAFMFSEGYRLVFDRWYLQAEPVKGADHRTEQEDWWVLEFGSIAVVEGEPGRIVSRELFSSREAADRAADDCEFSSRVMPLSDLLAACFAGGSPAKDVEAPAAINQDLIDARRYRWLRDAILDSENPIDGKLFEAIHANPSALDEALDSAMAAAPTGADGGLIEGEGV